MHSTREVEENIRNSQANGDPSWDSLRKLITSSNNAGNGYSELFAASVVNMSNCLTAQDIQLMQKLEPDEWIHTKKFDGEEFRNSCPSIVKYMENYNNLNRFVMNDVLNKSDNLSSLLLAYEYWVNVAYHMCYDSEIKNHSGANAVMSAIAELDNVLETRMRKYGKQNGIQDYLTPNARDKKEQLQFLINPSLYQSQSVTTNAIPVISLIQGRLTRNEIGAPIDVKQKIIEPVRQVKANLQNTPHKINVDIQSKITEVAKQGEISTVLSLDPVIPRDTTINKGVLPEFTNYLKLQEPKPQDKIKKRRYGEPTNKEIAQDIYRVAKRGIMFMAKFMDNTKSTKVNESENQHKPESQKKGKK